MSEEIEKSELKNSKNTGLNYGVEFGWERGERGETHLLEGQVGPTPHGGVAHTPAAPSYGVAAWWVPLVSPRYSHVAK